MTPVVYRWRKYRILFYSREEDRAHVHVVGPDGKAKIWLVPEISVAYNKGVRTKDLKQILEIIQSDYQKFLKAWEAHHGRSKRR